MNAKDSANIDTPPYCWLSKLKYKINHSFIHSGLWVDYNIKTKI